MDNFHIDVTSEGRAEFDVVLGIAVAHAPGAKAVAYCFHPEKGLVLLWTNRLSLAGSEVRQLPYPMKADAVRDFVWHWLQETDYGQEPDHDGSNGRGWRIYNEAWGHVAEDSAAFVAIQPVWAMYGK